MGETKTIAFDYKEVAQALIKHQGIHEGLWGIYIEFGLQAGNIKTAEESMVPAAIVPVLKIGIQKFDEPTPLTVDAAQVNPPPKEP